MWISRANSTSKSIVIFLIRTLDRFVFSLGNLNETAGPQFVGGNVNPCAEFEESEVSAKRFEYSVLRAATKNFAAERKLGEGAYGAVYKVKCLS